MPRHPLVEEWLEKWEEDRQRRPNLSLEEFVDEVCTASWQTLITDFRQTVFKLEKVNRLIDALSGNDSPPNPPPQ